MTTTTSLECVISLNARLQAASPIYAFLLSDAKIIYAKPGVMRARMVLDNQHINSHYTLHGATSACITDWSGGLAVATHGYESTGVSVDIHVTYLSTAKKGDIVEIEATADRVGRNMAYTSISVSRVDAGKDGKEVLTVVAKGSHTKYIAHAKKLPLILAEN